MKRWMLAFLFLIVVLGLSFDLSADVKPVVAVFDVEDRGANLPDSTLENLCEYIGTLLTAKGYQIIPRSDLKKRLMNQKRDSFKQCYDQSCQIEIGRELAAQKTLSTQIIKLGSRCKVTLTLYDLKKSASESGAIVSGSCTEDGVVHSMEKAVAKLAHDNSKKTSDDVVKPHEINQPGTNLFWLLCPLGKRWDGNTCQGASKRPEWDNASRECRSMGYRLPTLEEFAGILGVCSDIDSKKENGTCRTCRSSSTCRSMFGDDKDWYWTGSYHGGGTYTWYINFGNGDFVSHINRSTKGKYGVRCVRSRP